MEKYKTKLEEEKKLLEEELATMGKVDKTGDWQATPEDEMANQEVQDEADMADRSEDFEERASKLDLLEKRLNDINKALERLANQTYDVCEKCGGKIEMDRLDVNPAARTCKACMKNM